MEHRGRSKHDGDVMLTLGPDVIARLDEHRELLEAKTPGLRATRSLAARVLLLRALSSEADG